MTHKKVLLYDQGYSININTDIDDLFYYFDYDERSANINMEFQHFHQFYEIHILIDEKATHIIEGHFYAIQQYDMVFLKPSSLHKTEYPQGTPKKRLIINFAMPKSIIGLEDSFNSLFSIFDDPIPIFRFSESCRQNILSLINDIFTISKNNSPLNSLTIHTKFIEFLCAIYNNKSENLFVPQKFSNSITHKIYLITSYIHINYTEDLSLEFISKKFFISSYYLSHQFKNVTGFTFTKYVQMTRVRNSQQLLLYTDTRITDISEKCGFNSFSQFNRVFNRFSGISPSQYRLNRNISNVDIIPRFE